MSKFTPTRRGNPCQICGDTSLKCRETESVLLCMTITDIHNQPSGFKFLGVTKDGLWGKFIQDNGQTWSQQQQQLRQIQKQAIRQQLAQEEQQKSQLLGSVARDFEIRKILAQLPLKPEHLADLQRRGLSDDHIRTGMFRSVNQWQELEFAISHQLAGVDISGKSLITAAGYICPIWNPQGQIVGWQLRADDPEGGKYKWASSVTKKRPSGPTCHLPNGELPITCCRPYAGTSSKVVRLAEGVLKPWISAQLSNQIVLGASAANFASSPKTFKAYLDQLGAELGGIDEIILDADAGAIANRHVMRQYRRTHDLLRKWGYFLRIGWWGQHSKDDLDIDELLAAGRGDDIKIITFAEFQKQHRQEQKFHDRLSQEKRAGLLNSTMNRGASTDQPGSLPVFKEGIGDNIITAIGRLAKQLTKTFKGFGQPPKPSQNQPLTTIRYLPGELPSFEEYLQLGSPKIIYSGEHRRKIWQELVAKGYRLIQDASSAGSGKSHAAGKATLQEFGAEKLFYVASDHRNPTVATVEEGWVDLPVRHNGLFEDTTKKTALGSNHIRWAKEGETPNIVGNCFRAPLFHILANKGYQLEVSKEAGINPICRTCHLQHACKGRDVQGNVIDSVPGASFRKERQAAIGATHIRAHLNSIPNPQELKKGQGGEEAGEKGAGGKGEKELMDNNSFSSASRSLCSHTSFSSSSPVPPSPSAPLQPSRLNATEHKIGAFIDEVSRQLVGVDFTNVDIADFDSTLMQLQYDQPDVYDQIKSILLPLRPLLTGEIPITQDNYHGWGDAAIREIIGQQGQEYKDALTLLQENAPDLEEILRNPDSVTLDGLSTSDRSGVSRATIKFLRDTVRQESYRKIYQQVQNLPSNWLVPLLEVLALTKQGAVRVKNRRLIIATKNTRQAQTIKGFDFTFLLDATANREILALYLDVDPSTIALIQEELPQYTNLIIHQITGMGLLGKERSNSVKTRVAALREELGLRHPDIAFIDHFCTKEASDGYWFVDNRGSNAYQNLSALASFGIPYQDIGALQQIYITLTGVRDVSRNAPGFSAFVNHLVQAEIVQYVGRLRANRRPSFQLTAYIVAEGDLSYLHSFYAGVTLVQSTAFEITPQAGTAVEVVRWSILQAARQLLDAGEKLTQKAIASLIGRNQGRISQVAAEMGGWKLLKKILVTLCNVLSCRTANNFSPLGNVELSSEERWAAQTYLPLIITEAAQDSEQVVKEVVAVAQSTGWRMFERVLRAMQPFELACLILHFATQLPDAVLRQIQKLLAEILLTNDLVEEVG